MYDIKVVGFNSQVSMPILKHIRSSFLSNALYKFNQKIFLLPQKFLFSQ